MSVAVVAIACTGCAAGITGQPAYVAGSQAQLSGQVRSNTGGTVEYWVQYGPTTSYGSESAHKTVTVEPNGQASVFVQLTGLQLATTYHYRLCAQDSQQQGGPGCGADATFTTPNVDCGQPVTSDVQLSADLFCEPREDTRNGLVVGADGIVIDLGGHQVNGNGGAGIDNSGGFDDVTIRNGGADAFGTGILLDGASRNRIVNVEAGTDTNEFGFYTGTGISIDGGQANVIRDSDLGGESTGFSANDSPGLLVEGSNAYARFGFGISIHSDLARVRNNHSFEGTAISGSSNRIVGNVSSGSVGILVSSGAGNVVAENRAGGASLFGEADGIFVNAAATNTLLRANLAIGSDDDGIDTESPSTRLKDNSANDNRDLGIEAVPGVIDLGGNTGSGNGNPLQCLNVVCQ